MKRTIATLVLCCLMTPATAEQESPSRARQKTPDRLLFDAVLLADTEKVETALEAGADPNFCLHSAPPLFGGPPCVIVLPSTGTLYTDDKSVDVGRLLISAGADVNMEFTDDGWTALTLAIRHKRYQYARLLLENGANLNVPLQAARHQGITPLYILIHGGDAKDVAFAIDNGADPNVRWNDWTPLLYAIKRNESDTARLLVEKGATLELSDPVMAATLARLRGRSSPEIRELIDTVASQ